MPSVLSVSRILWDGRVAEFEQSVARLDRHLPVWEEFDRLGQDVPKECGRWRNVREYHGGEHPANARAASMSSFVLAQVNRQVTEQTIVRGW